MASVFASVGPVLRVTEREFRFFRSTWRATSFTMFGGPLLFLVALGIGLGGLVEDRQSLGGLEYLEFIAPGMMVGAAAQLAAGSGLWPIMAGHRWLGFHRAMVATPLAPTSIVGGLLVWLGLRSVAQATVFLAVSALLGGIISGWAVLAIPVAALTAVAFAAALMAYTATCDSDKAFDPIMRIGVAPLYLFSGTFFSTDSLPSWLQWLVRAFPLWHGIELARRASTGVAGTWPPIANLAVLAVWVLAGWYAARRTFTTRLTS